MNRFIPKMVLLLPFFLASCECIQEDWRQPPGQSASKAAWLAWAVPDTSRATLDGRELPRFHPIRIAMSPGWHTVVITKGSQLPLYVKFNTEAGKCYSLEPNTLSSSGSVVGIQVIKYNYIVEEYNYWPKEKDRIISEMGLPP